MILRSSALLVATAVALPAQAQWQTDFAAAQATAKKDGKDLLIDFTGSDWCGWCIKLREEVFDHEEFQKKIGEHFVLVELDFPRGKEQSEELRTQNQELIARFGVEGFPTLFLTDADGMPFAQTGYQPGGPEKYLEHLGELRAHKAARDEKFAMAAKLSGSERAKALRDGLEALPAELRRHPTYAATFKAIIAADDKDEAGLKSEFTELEASIVRAAKLASVREEFQKKASEDDWAGGAKVISEFLAAGEPDAATAHELRFYLGVAYGFLGEHKKALEVLEAAKKLLPDHPANTRIDEMIAEAKAKLAEGKDKDG